MEDSDQLHPSGKEDSLEKFFLQAGTGTVSPLTRGSVLHRCLEEFANTGAYDLGRIMLEYPDIGALGDAIRQSFAADADSVLKAVLGKDEFRWIFERGPRAYSELPFLYRRGPDIVSGKIDRVVIRDGAGYVIDYKAILIENDDALRAWCGHYRPQVGIYCEAVKNIFSLQVVEGLLLFLDSGRLETCSRL